MQKTKRWMLGAVAVVGLMTCGALFDRVSTNSAAAQTPVRDHWCNHKGHWSVWHEADHRWYTTDGRHWFWHDGHEWRLYRFDRNWGREGFVHGEYVAPAHEVKLVLPPLHAKIVVR